MRNAVDATPRWIISRHEDLLRFQGSVAAELALLALELRTSAIGD